MRTLFDGGRLEGRGTLGITGRVRAQCRSPIERHWIAGVPRPYGWRRIRHRFPGQPDDPMHVVRHHHEVIRMRFSASADCTPPCGADHIGDFVPYEDALPAKGANSYEIGAVRSIVEIRQPNRTPIVDFRIVSHTDEPTWMLSLSQSTWWHGPGVLGETLARRQIYAFHASPGKRLLFSGCRVPRPYRSGVLRARGERYDIPKTA